MQAFVDLAYGFMCNIRKIIAMFLLAGLALAAIIGLTVYGSAPVIAEEAGERVENFADAQLAQALEEERAAKCDHYRARAAEAWNYAVNTEASDRHYARIDELDRQADRYCNP